jgi:CBS domain containing-hemolysin-like protein
MHEFRRNCRDGIDVLLVDPARADLAWEGGLVALDDIMRPMIYVPLTARISTVLREMQAKRIQIATVVHEHGTTIGLVTIEEPVGEIFGETASRSQRADRAERQCPRARMASYAHR